MDLFWNVIMKSNTVAPADKGDEDEEGGNGDEGSPQQLVNGIDNEGHVWLPNDVEQGKIMRTRKMEDNFIDNGVYLILDNL